MEISGNSGGAALYALQQAKKTPNEIVDLLKKSTETTQQPLATTNPSDQQQAAEVAKMTGKGGNINVMA